MDGFHRLIMFREVAGVSKDNRTKPFYAQDVRLALVVIPLFLAACASSPAPREPEKADATTENWYGQAVDELVSMNRQAREYFQKRKQDEAAAVIEKGEVLSRRLLSVPHPTLAATQAASDLDQLYGEMLFSNRNYGWARLLFQKNASRWKNWTPQTPETAQRLKESEALIAKCDRRIGE
jgi:hypothetical protein